MPEIKDLQAWVKANNATCIDPLPGPDPNQRGPTCGFYALAFVMGYWHGRNGLLPTMQARTNNLAPPQQPKDQSARDLKANEAKKGSFSSLRQYGKFQGLTAYGSVFNAENIVQVARGAGASYDGHYDGKVIVTKDVSDFVAKVKALIAEACPAIVPFDVGNGGDPELHTGTRAHWSVICGWCSQKGGDVFLHRHWGKYRESNADDFARSCQSLTSNALLEFEKTELKHPKTGVVSRREWMTAESASAAGQNGWVVNPLGRKGVNLEFCDPQDATRLPQRIPDPNRSAAGKFATAFWDVLPGAPWDSPNINEELRKHGFEPQNVSNNGLRGRVVAVYPVGTTINV